MIFGLQSTRQCCGAIDLRRGVLVFSAFQALLSLPRFLAAVTVVWAWGSAYLALVPGAFMYGLAGWAGIQATKDRRMVLAWDPRIRAAAKMCTGIAIAVDIVDVAALVDLLIWQNITGEPPGTIVFVAVQQSFLVGLQSYMVYVLWSYYWCLRTFQPVMPEQENLPPPSMTANAYPSSERGLAMLFSNAMKPISSPASSYQPPTVPPFPLFGMQPCSESLEVLKTAMSRNRGLSPRLDFLRDRRSSSSWSRTHLSKASGSLTDIQIVVSPPSWSTGDADQLPAAASGASYEGVERGGVDGGRDCPLVSVKIIS